MKKNSFLKAMSVALLSISAIAAGIYYNVIAEQPPIAIQATADDVKFQTSNFEIDTE